MRLGISFKILPGVRVGASFGARRKPRLWATERLGPIRLTESTSGARRRRTRTR